MLGRCRGRIASLGEQSSKRRKENGKTSHYNITSDLQKQATDYEETTEYLINQIKEKFYKFGKGIGKTFCSILVVANQH